MPCELRIPLDDGNLPRAPAFIGRLEFSGDSQAEGGNELEGHRRPVIVEDSDNEVRIKLTHQLFRVLEAFEESAPVLVFGLSLIDGVADGVDMRTPDTGNDPGHQELAAPTRCSCSALLRL